MVFVCIYLHDTNQQIETNNIQSDNNVILCLSLTQSVCNMFTYKLISVLWCQEEQMIFNTLM